MADKRVSIEIDAESRRRLKILAAHAGTTVKEFLRLLVEQEWVRSNVSRATQD